MPLDYKIKNKNHHSIRFRQTLSHVKIGPKIILKKGDKENKYD